MGGAGVEFAGGGAEPVDDEELWATTGVEQITRAATIAIKAVRNTNSLNDQFIGRSLAGAAECSTRGMRGGNRAWLARASKSEQTDTRKVVDSQPRRWTVPSQFENPEATKLEDETVAEGSADEKVERVAEKAARKSTKTEQEYDKEHDLFTI